MQSPIRILIAHDHPIFRWGLRVVLDAAPDLTMVGETGSGDEAIRLATSPHPDVVLLDLQMPGPNGLEATRQILRETPHIGVLVVTMFEDDESVFAAMRAGARV